MRRYALCGRVIDQGAQGHLAVLWLRDDTIAATETAAAIRIGDGFRKSLGSFPFPVWRRRRELTFDYVNPAYLDAVEAEPEARPDDAPELSAGATGNSGRALASRAAETRNPQTEAHHIVAAGARRLMELTEAPVGGDGAIGGFAIDRTEVEEIKTELARHIENHEQVLHNLGTAIAIYGADRRLEFFNTAYVKLWEIDEALLSGRPTLGEVIESLREARKLPEQANFPEFKASRNAVFTSLIDPLDELVHLPEGKTLRSVAAPHPFGGLLITWEDVTASLALERSYNTLIAVQKETLETADRLKSKFIANVSYELRTPLNTIVGFSEILTGEYFGTLNERQGKYSRSIYESSQRLLSLINDILDLATIQSGHMSLKPESVDAYSVLTSVLGLTREQVLRKSLKLDFDCPEEIGLIMADERRLKQVLFNILSNSVKFTPEDGEITVSARRVEDNIIITFTDTGIPEEDHERIFGRFERGNQPETRRTGAGLGLSLVQSFINLHGGDVELESEPGVGTKVVCRLPSRRADEDTQRLAGNG